VDDEDGEDLYGSSSSSGGGSGDVPLQGDAQPGRQQQQQVVSGSGAAARVLEELLGGCCCREERATLLPEAFMPPGLQVGWGWGGVGWWLCCAGGCDSSADGD
jgi:hypothetical protein